MLEGIETYLPDRRVVLMNADGGSSDSTVRHFEEARTPANVSTLLILYQGQAGKGTATRAIFEAAMELQAKSCTVIEARAPGIRPEWVPALVDPILRGADMVLPCYERSAFASALTDNLAFPFLNSLFGSRLREPLPCEFSVSGELAAELAGRDVWETDVARFGINAWLGLQAVLVAPTRRPGAHEARHAGPVGPVGSLGALPAEGHRATDATRPLQVTQVNLGYRGDGSYEPGAPLDLRFLHAVGTLFRVLTTHRRQWQSDVRAAEAVAETLPVAQSEHVPAITDSSAFAEPLIEALYEGRKRYAALWEQILSREYLKAINDLMQVKAACLLPIDLWVKIVTEFAIVFNRGEGDPDKVVEALLPLFYGRAASYVCETQGMGVAQRDQVVQEIAHAFLKMRPLFVEKWNHYEPWISDTGAGSAGYWSS